MGLLCFAPPTTASKSLGVRNFITFTQRTKIHLTRRIAMTSGFRVLCLSLVALAATASVSLGQTNYFFRPTTCISGSALAGRS